MAIYDFRCSDECYWDDQKDEWVFLDDAGTCGEADGCCGLVEFKTKPPYQALALECSGREGWDTCVELDYGEPLPWDEGWPCFPYTPAEANTLDEWYQLLIIFPPSVVCNGTTYYLKEIKLRIWKYNTVQSFERTVLSDRTLLMISKRYEDDPDGLGFCGWEFEPRYCAGPPSCYTHLLPSAHASGGSYEDWLS
jgi:hypothetical protein